MSTEHTPDKDLSLELKKVLQIRDTTFLAKDYRNQYIGFPVSLSILAEAMKEGSPYAASDIAELKLTLLRNVKNFRNYSEYLKKQAEDINSEYFMDQMTPVDEEDFAEQLLLMSPYGDEAQRISLEFQAELAKIQTENDLPRLNAIVNKYKPQLEHLFLKE